MTSIYLGIEDYKGYHKDLYAKFPKATYSARGIESDRCCSIIDIAPLDHDHITEANHWTLNFGTRGFRVISDVIMPYNIQMGDNIDVYVNKKKVATGPFWSFSFLDVVHSDDGGYDFAANIYTTPQGGLGFLLSGAYWNTDLVYAVADLSEGDPMNIPFPDLELYKRGLVNNVLVYDWLGGDRYTVKDGAWVPREKTTKWILNKVRYDPFLRIDWLNYRPPKLSAMNH